MTAGTEEGRDHPEDRQESLRVSGCLEAAHAPLSFSSRLMGVFRPIVQPALLLMLHRRHDFCLGCCVAAQLVGDDGTWDVLKAFQQLAKELLGGFLVPAWLHEDIKHVVILVDCTP